jgi:predicted glycosyltransferase
LKLLIDIGHNAHVHLFKNLAIALIYEGWDVLFSVREKGENVALLRAYGLPFRVYGLTAKSIGAKIFSVFRKNHALSLIFRSFKPTITISHSSFSLSQVSWFYRIPNITLEDTGNMEQILLYLPFTKVMLTPETYHRTHGKMQIRYNGFHENAYIHPNFLKLNPGLSNPSRPVILIRLVDWYASHDIGQKGLSGSVIQEFISLMNGRAEMKILSEKPLPAEWQRYALQIAPHKLHDYLNQVKLYIGEGATLASECAMLGIPSIYINSRSAGVIEAQAGAGMLYHYKNSDGVIAKAQEILSDPDSMSIHKARANQFLKDKINLSRFLVWFISNYPESHHIMKQNPDYQYNFR